MKNFRKSIVLLSGGIDSTLTTDFASEESEELYILHLNYEQRTSEKELQCAERIANYYASNDFKVIKLDWLKEVTKSSLVNNDIEVPRKRLPNPNDVPNTYVPFRNGIIASLASAWAESIKADAIWVGVNDASKLELGGISTNLFWLFKKENMDWLVDHNILGVILSNYQLRGFCLQPGTRYIPKVVQGRDRIHRTILVGNGIP